MPRGTKIHCQRWPAAIQAPLLRRLRKRLCSAGRLWLLCAFRVGRVALRSMLLASSDGSVPL
eukprot:3209232-Alexandrium_andersonii.AAC.1